MTTVTDSRHSARVLSWYVSYSHSSCKRRLL